MRSVGIKLLMVLLAAVIGWQCSSENRRMVFDTMIDGINENPDSILSELKLIEQTDKLDGMNAEERARWQTLLCLASDKSYALMPSDSLIHEAYLYYKDKKTSRYKAYAEYYEGMKEFSHGNFSSAVVIFLKAKDTSESLNDHLLSGLICRHLSDIYGEIHDGENQVAYAELASEYFKKAKSQSHYLYSLADKALAYNNIKDYPKCKTIAKTLLNEAHRLSDSDLVYESHRILATAELSSGNYSEAIAHYQLMPEDSLTPVELSNYSLALIETGNPDDARKLLVRSGIKAPEAWCEYNRAIGNYREALEGADRDLAIQNDILHQILTQNVTKSVDDYRKYELELSNREKKLHKSLLLILILVGILLIVIVWFIQYRRLKRRKESELKNILLAQNLRKILAANEAKLQVANESNMELFTRQFELLDDLCSNYYETKDTSREKQKVYENVMTLIQGLSSNKETVAIMAKRLNDGLDGLYDKFEDEFPNIKEADKRLFIYLVMGFSPRAISVLLSEKLEVVYNRKSTLKRRVKASNSPYKSIFMRYFT